MKVNPIWPAEQCDVPRRILAAFSNWSRQRNRSTNFFWKKFQVFGNLNMWLRFFCMYCPYYPKLYQIGIFEFSYTNDSEYDLWTPSCCFELSYFWTENYGVKLQITLQVAPARTKLYHNLHHNCLGKKSCLSSNMPFGIRDVSAIGTHSLLDSAAPAGRLLFADTFFAIMFIMWARISLDFTQRTELV